MAISITQQLQRDLSDLTGRVDTLDLVVNGDEEKDVAGVRSRLTMVEQLAANLAAARKEDRQRWIWVARGIAIGLAANIVGNLPGIIQFINSYLLPLLQGVHP
jgi:hypothetical protein